MAYDPARLQRGSQLAVRQLGPGEFAVQGSRGVRYVNLNSDLPCDCEDADYRANRGPCKHVCAARLASGDMALIQALGEQLLRREARKAET